jgi:hypothetical protein
MYTQKVRREAISEETFTNLKPKYDAVEKKFMSDYASIFDMHFEENHLTNEFLDLFTHRQGGIRNTMGLAWCMKRIVKKRGSRNQVKDYETRLAAWEVTVPELRDFILFTFPAELAVQERTWLELNPS